MSGSRKNYGVNTLAIHRGYKSELSDYSVMPPLYDSTTYSYRTAESFEKAFINMLKGKKGVDAYSRVGSPNSNFVQDRMCSLEPGASGALVFNSGMAGITTTFLACLADKKEKIVHYTSPVYGGTHCFIHDVLSCYGVTVKNIISDVKSGYFGDTKKRSLGVVFIETPANPTMCVYDINAIASEAKKIDPKCVVVVDNTFLGVFQQPFLISPHVDIIVYSATKFISGYSDVLAGMVMFKKKTEFLMKKVLSFRIVLGNILNPASCKLLLRSLPSYGDRMRKQAGNAVEIIKFLRQQDEVKGIRYPGISSDSDVIKPIGSVMSIYLDANKKETFKFLNTVGKSGIISLAVSLGGIESLITHPATTTHSEMSSDELVAAGITDNLVRLSVGMEDTEDLIQILKEGFEAIK